MNKKKNSIAKNKSKKTKNQTDEKTIKKKKFTSRHRKALIKIVEKRLQNKKRLDMISELKSLELSASSLALMTSISQTQTKGLRNTLKEKKKQTTTQSVTENNSNLDKISVDEEDIGSELNDNEIA